MAASERDMPADTRRPVEAAVASIKLNEKVKAAALPDIDLDAAPTADLPTNLAVGHRAKTVESHRSQPRAKARYP